MALECAKCDPSRPPITPGAGSTTNGDWTEKLNQPIGKKKPNREYKTDSKRLEGEEG
jgi:hypothetical protein